MGNWHCPQRVPFGAVKDDVPEGVWSGTSITQGVTVVELFLVVPSDTVTSEHLIKVMVTLQTMLGREEVVGAATTVLEVPVVLPVGDAGCGAACRLDGVEAGSDVVGRSVLVVQCDLLEGGEGVCKDAD